MKHSIVTASGSQAVRDVLRKGLLGIALLAIAIAAIFVASRVYAQDGTTEVPGGKVITLYERGVERSFVTTASTVGGALEQADIEVDARDRVEPALDEDLVADSYTINLYRARPLLVVDGMHRAVVMTAARVPAQIAKDADITLHDEDITAFERSTDLLADGAAERLVVTRATPFTLTLYGETFTARTQASTVDEMLKEKEIALGEDDRVSLPGSTPITEGMELRVWREGTQTVTAVEEVDFPVEKIHDVNREAGFKEVRTPGVKGQRTVTYEITIQDGVEVNRREIASVTNTEPTKQVEVIGVKPSTQPYTGGGNKDTWLAASSIPRDQWGYAEWLVQKESGWNPNAVNRSSGACGLGQQLPCGKWAGAWNDPVAGLNGMHGYVMGRYGSWEAAVNHSKARGWY